MLWSSSDWYLYVSRWQGFHSVKRSCMLLVIQSVRYSISGCLMQIQEFQPATRGIVQSTNSVDHTRYRVEGSRSAGSCWGAVTSLPVIHKALQVLVLLQFTCFKAYSYHCHHYIIWRFWSSINLRRLWTILTMSTQRTWVQKVLFHVFLSLLQLYYWKRQEQGEVCQIHARRFGADAGRVLWRKDTGWTEAVKSELSF